MQTEISKDININNSIPCWAFRKALLKDIISKSKDLWNGKQSVLAGYHWTLVQSPAQSKEAELSYSFHNRNTKLL